MKSYQIYMISGAVVGTIIAILMGSFTAIYNSIVDKNLVLEKDAKIMESFTIPPVPIYMQFYLFNVTNPDEVQFYNAKPILKQLGPYVFEEKREKVYQEFSEDGNTIKYRNRFQYFFDEKRSGPWSLSDTITTVDIVFASLAAMEYNFEHIGLIWPELEKTMGIFQQRNVSDLLFEGWQLPTFDFNFEDIDFDLFGLPIPHLEGTIAEILSQLGVSNASIPEVLWENKIGYFSLLNNTDDGLYEVNTGKSDISDLLDIQKWNDSESLSYWGTDLCNMINGTDGTQFPPRSVYEEQTLYIFVTQLCRSLYLKFDKHIDFKGISAMRFRPPAEMLASPTENPDNMCYCEVGTLGPDCLPSGFLEMTPCLKIPLVTSTPHFYNGDPAEVEKFEGLVPNADEHDTILDVERTLGVPVSAHKRIQLNLPLRKWGRLTSFMNFDSLLFPVMWVDEFAELGDSDADTMKMALYLPFTLVYALGGIIIVVSLVLLFVGLKKRADFKNNRTTV